MPTVFPTIRNASRILVVSDGVIAESGTHAELIEKGGAYAELYRTQAASQNCKCTAGELRLLRRAGRFAPYERGVFRPLRRATGGAAPGPLRFFEKNRVKLLMFGIFYWIWCSGSEEVR